MSVTLWIGTGSLVGGARTSSYLEIHNNSNVEVRYDQDLCILEQGLSFVGPYGPGPQPTDDPGRPWSDPRLAKVKTTALSDPVSLIGFRPSFTGDDVRTPITCALSAGDYGLRPGGVIRDDEFLFARRTDGLPATPGIYNASFTFLTDPPISVMVLVQVTGAPYDGVSRAVAIDVTLGDPAMAAWLVSLGVSGIDDGDAWFDKGVWTITIRAQSGQATATVDASGKLLAVDVPRAGG